MREIRLTLSTLSRFVYFSNTKTKIGYRSQTFLELSKVIAYNKRKLHT